MKRIFYFLGEFMLKNKIEIALNNIYGNFTLLFFEEINSDVFIFCKRINFENKYSLFKYSIKENKINYISTDISLKEAILKFNNLINK